MQFMLKLCRPPPYPEIASLPATLDLARLRKWTAAPRRKTPIVAFVLFLSPFTLHSFFNNIHCLQTPLSFARLPIRPRTCFLPHSFEALIRHLRHQSSPIIPPVFLSCVLPLCKGSTTVVCSPRHDSSLSLGRWLSIHSSCGNYLFEVALISHFAVTTSYHSTHHSLKSKTHTPLTTLHSFESFRTDLKNPKLKNRRSIPAVSCCIASHNEILHCACSRDSWIVGRCTTTSAPPSPPPETRHTGGQRTWSDCHCLRI